MMPSIFVTDLSRSLFAFTAMFHFMFVPLTLGLTWIVVMMEAAYLKTGKVVYKDMTQFWGKLLAINFAIGVISGLTMEFEFGLNWAYFSRMIGGSFGPVLAIEGITAFMLEATMFGLFFFTWNKVSKRTHFVITFFMAFGAILSIVNILAANSWMQHVVATTLNPVNMTLQLHSIAALYLNALAQIRIGHVAFGAFLVSSVFVMGISAFYILKNRDTGFANRSFAVAAGFAFIVSLESSPRNKPTSPVSNLIRRRRSPSIYLFLSCSDENSIVVVISVSILDSSYFSPDSSGHIKPNHFSNSSFASRSF